MQLQGENDKYRNLINQLRQDKGFQVDDKMSAGVSEPTTNLAKEDGGIREEGEQSYQNIELQKLEKARINIEARLKE